MPGNSLARELRAAVPDTRFDDGARALYATDASNYRQLPVGVVVPRNREELIAAVTACRNHDASVLCRGAGTSLAGQCCNRAVVIDVSKHLNRIRHVDPDNRTARVEPGVVLDDLRAETEKHGLTFAPDPATHDHATLGGMIGNNSCGVHSMMSGRAADNVAELEILTYDGACMRVGATPKERIEDYIRQGGRRGEIYAGLRDLRDRYSDEIRQRYPDIPRRVSGYNLDELLPDRGFQVARALVGTECTCAVTLEATVQLVPSPAHRVLLVLGFDDVYAAADQVPTLLALDHGPVGLEGIDSALVEDARRRSLGQAGIERLPEGNGWLLAEFGADVRDDAVGFAEDAAARVRREAPDVSCVILKDEQAAAVWRVRESGLGATAHVSKTADTQPGWEDAAVPPPALGRYLREFHQLLDRFDYSGDLYGHFGQGCVHTRINFGLESAQGRQHFRHFLEEASDLVLQHGGSLSGEHGDGQARAALLGKMYGPELMQAFSDFKALWDPRNRMNPGKVVDADGPLAHLRLAKPLDSPATRFAYREDDGSFPWAMRRCVGVGECRKTDSGVMCPSYMATREEKYSTRGRARLLYEMLVGDAVRDGWRSESVKDALDLCLSCKACKSECPVNVDMATYKAEFMSHYYKGKLRPRAAYAFGMIDTWAKWAARLPGGLAGMLRLRGETILKRAAGVAPQRSLPPMPRQDFRKWLAGHGDGDAGGGAKPVILWADTFNNYFTPDVARAAYRSLRRLGHTVIVPPPACCGRPAYAFGMLDRAERHGRRALATLCAPALHDLPVICLEPACASVFTDELPELLDDTRAREVAERVVLFADFLADRDFGGAFRSPGKAIVHPHCYQRAVFDDHADNRVLTRIGMEPRLLDAGCCGMAGSFGFEADKYDISVTLAERKLLPAIRGSEPDDKVVSDGFACREQIRQLSDRRALHLAEVLDAAMTGGDSP